MLLNDFRIISLNSKKTIHLYWREYRPLARIESDGFKWKIEFHKYFVDFVDDEYSSRRFWSKNRALRAVDGYVNDVCDEYSFKAIDFGPEFEKLEEQLLSLEYKGPESEEEADRIKEKINVLIAEHSYEISKMF